jgi:regulator of RNase E activity RraA
LSDQDELTADLIERALRWALIDGGTAGLSDDLGPGVLVPAAPAVVLPAEAAVAGPVVLMRRASAGSAAPPRSSFDALRAAVRPGAVVLVHCEPGVGAAFGSNIALHAASLRAQAIVSDGPFRDRTRMVQTGVVCAAAGMAAQRPAGAPMAPVESQAMFGVTWRTGDWFLRDADAVIRLTPDLAVRTARRLADSATDELSALLGRG